MATNWHAAAAQLKQQICAAGLMHPILQMLPEMWPTYLTNLQIGCKLWCQWIKSSKCLPDHLRIRSWGILGYHELTINMTQVWHNMCLWLWEEFKISRRVADHLRWALSQLWWVQIREVRLKDLLTLRCKKSGCLPPTASTTGLSLLLTT